MRSAISTAPSGLVGDPPLRAAHPELVQEPAEALTVLGEIDRLVRRSEHLEAGRLDRSRELQRRLAAELDHDPFGLLALADGEHRLDVERLEVEPVGGVVVGRDRLRVAVDHHRLVAERAEALGGVDAAVVELDPLADPVRAGAEDHDARLGRRRQRLVGLSRGSSSSSSSRPRPRRRRSRRGGRHADRSAGRRGAARRARGGTTGADRPAGRRASPRA